MKQIRNPAAWKQTLSQHAAAGLKAGFVPTMGALHKGHLSLMERAKAEQDILAVSIFVNPAQFNDPKDLRDYPDRIEQDIAQLTEIGADYLFLPGYDDLYPDSFRYTIAETEFSRQLCGKDRPGHFTGVLTVVLKLLLLTGAQAAYFGEKDWQQYKLIRGLAEAFFLETEIIPCPVVREDSGLACSSRNDLLSSTERRQAAQLFRVLSKYARKPCVGAAESAARELADKGFAVEYLQQVEDRLLAAVRIGSVRLIDNVRITAISTQY